MAQQHLTLTDLANDVWLETAELSASSGISLAGSPNWSLRKRTLKGGVSAGVDVVTVDNGAFRVEVLPTRGMGLWRGEFQGQALGWRSPNRFPVHPALVNTTAWKGLGWLTGFNEWMCRCGLESMGSPDLAERSDARPTTLHGRVANLPANFVECHVDSTGTGRLSVRGIVEETALFGPNLRIECELQTDAGSNELELVDTVTNLSQVPAEMQLLYHYNFGPPFLEAGAHVVMPVEEVAPYDEYSGQFIAEWNSFPEPTPGFRQHCFLVQPLQSSQEYTPVVLCNASEDRAIRLAFRTAELPCFTLWKYCAGDADGYVVGLEPGTGYPLPRSAERISGRVPLLAGGAQRQFACKVQVLTERSQVAAALSEVQQLQGGHSPPLHRHMPPNFGPCYHRPETQGTAQ